MRAKKNKTMQRMETENEAMILTVTSEDAGKRLDQLSAEAGGLTRSAATRLIESGDITVNGKKAAKNLRLKAGDEISILLPEPEASEVLPQNIPLDVVYEDEEVKDYPFGCNFSRHATIEPLLKVFEATGTIETSIHGRKIWIRKRK